MKEIPLSDDTRFLTDSKGKHWLVYHDTTEILLTPEIIRNLKEILRETCTWTRNDDDYDRSCKKRKFRFCPYCGGSIVSTKEEKTNGT